MLGAFSSPLAACRVAFACRSVHNPGMARVDRKWRGKVLLTGAVITLVVAVADSAGWLITLERWGYDRRAAWCQYFTPPQTDRLVHVDIDDPALESIGAWPWQRSTFAKIIDEIALAQPKAIALDILFTERQRTEIVPAANGDIRSTQGNLQRVDHDAALADAFERAGNVLLPASWNLAAAPKASPLGTALVQTLAGNLELNEGQAVAMLREKGFAEPELPARVAESFLGARRQAARQRIAAELDKPGGARTLADIRKAVLPTTNLDVGSPLRRMIDEELDKVMAAHALRRFGRPIPAGVDVYAPPLQLAPVGELTESAGATAFVDYPVSADGKVRSVPLVIQYDGKLYPQMGLMLAAMIRGLDPSTFVISDASVTIPGGGKDGRDLVLPAGSQFVDSLGQDVPHTFDIPWSGTSRWEQMYGGQGHISINLAYDAVRTREKIENNNAVADAAILYLLGSDPSNAAAPGFGLDRNKAREYATSRPAASDFDARRAVATHAVATLEQRGLLKQFEQIPVNELTPDEKVQSETLRNADRALRNFVAEGPGLQAQLTGQRNELQRRLKDKGVLIGWAATAMVADIKPTPIHAECPGVVVHGMIVNAILTGDTWWRAPAWIGTLVTIVLGLVTTVVVGRLTPPVAAVVAVAVLIPGYLVLNGLLIFDYGNILLGIAGPVAAVAAVWSGGTLTRLIDEAVERARITNRFRSYVDRKVVDHFLSHPDLRVLDGQLQEMTVVFTDLDQFTRLSEKLGEETVRILNEFMDLVVPLIPQHNGLMNKFLGDGLMFFFNAPDRDANHAANAVATILEMQKIVPEFNATLAERKLPPIGLRAGISTGEMIVGDAGARSQQRVDYTVLGDNVNLGARLESANKAFGTSNLVSGRTVELCGGADSKFLFRPIARLRVVGKDIPVMTYEALAVMDQATDRQKELAELTGKVVECFHDCRPADCLEALARLEEMTGETKLTHLYRDRCQQYLDDPSAGEFEAQIVLTEK